MKRLSVAVWVYTAFALAGCGDSFSYKTEIRKISIKTAPSGAKVYQIPTLQGCSVVYVDEDSRNAPSVFLGTTPLEKQPVSVLVNIKGDVSPRALQYLSGKFGMVRVRIEKEGYKIFETHFSTDSDESTEYQISLEPEDD